MDKIEELVNENEEGQSEEQRRELMSICTQKRLKDEQRLLFQKLGRNLC
jgi:hypothetical protein